MSLAHGKGAAPARAVLPVVAGVSWSIRIEGIGLGVAGTARDLPFVIARGRAHLAQAFSRPPAKRIGLTPIHTANREAVIERARAEWARFGNQTRWVGFVGIKFVGIKGVNSRRLQILARIVRSPIGDASVENAEPRAIVADAHLELIHPKASRAGIVDQNKVRSPSGLGRFDGVTLSASRGLRQRRAALELLVTTENLTAPRSERCHDEQRENDGLPKHWHVFR